MGVRELGRQVGNALAKTSTTGDVRGEAVFTIPGSYLWVCPPGVFSVCALAVGPGGRYLYNGAGNYYGGGGGALGWANDIPVIPWQSYAVIVGAGGFSINSTSGGGGGPHSSVFGMTAGAGSYPEGGVLSFSGLSLSASKRGGGNGGRGYNNSAGASAGGGGAGGYSGNGGDGSGSGAGSSGNGLGGGGGGGMQNSGGGVGIFGEGPSGSGASAGPGGGGSGGSPGSSEAADLNTSTFGGGAGLPPSHGGNGAVRILWGAGRAFPSTDVGRSY